MHWDAFFSHKRIVVSEASLRRGHTSVNCVQAAAAEEAVLWDLTTRVIDAVYDIQAVLDMVSLLPPCCTDSRRQRSGQLPCGRMLGCQG